MVSDRSTAEPRRHARDTSAKLVRAAAKEFNRHGFSGTDTNKIARRAGFAPQTFYRWFGDKTEIFLAAYRAWEEEEMNMLAALLAEQAPVGRLVDAIVSHHRAYRIFRRSLRQLSLEDPTVRKARAESRLRQIERIKEWGGRSAPASPEIATTLLQLERLADAIAEEELADLGLGERAARDAIAGLLARLR